ncbi:MAG: M48 family metallopeptidase [Paracoccus sp. (in: a-proteobacteria)]|uniref:M48 family metallopeptidase n=1 Tax=Paracoccus sp. TaxID=267 RepID=UPI0026E04EFF|nr:M48 family metallopeptidase [Paracoccus sp. (in: a-proteobacteria)]MDO5622406.1 M48 family metallopeptidase [Paracoccus sp. (in: a-proteobacteria)]
MLKFLPFLLIVLYAAALWIFSAARSKAHLARHSTPLDHPRLNPMLDRLGAAMDLPPIRAHVYEIAPVNGLATPDGRVYLTRGFLDALDRNEVSEAELASVIAHELGHVTHGHARRRLIDVTGQQAIRLALAGVLGRFIPFIGGWIAHIASSAVTAHLSRSDEYQADAFAAALMVKAGLGTAPQKSLLAKIERMSGAGAAPPWLMSHPATAKRIAAIEALERRWSL